MPFSYKIVLLMIAGLALAVPQAVLSQDTLADEMSTTERLSRSAWWPTKFSGSSDKYVGNAACAECHAGITKAQQESEMGRTLMPVAESKLASYAGKQVSVDGFLYQFLSTPQGLAFTLPAIKNSAPKPLTWAFGSGAISQVYITPEQSSFNESHFSYFAGIDGFDVTPAQPTLRTGKMEPQGIDTIKKEIGRTVPMQEARRCFVCHAANVPAEGPLAEIVPGVSCEACHGPGGHHVVAMRAGLPQGGALIMNPSHLRPVDQVDFCGSCHGTSIDVQLGGSIGLPSVRFPAYRLQNSACWSNDTRIQCTGCHDPHKSLLHDAASYDARCLACHASSVAAKTDAEHPGRACPTGTKDCARCHMPKYEFPDVHHKFTDHQIRVVKPGEHIPA